MKTFELKIGMFIIIGLVLLTIITFSIGEFVFKSGYYIKVILNFADGVQVSAPVRLAGIEVGEVKKTKVYKDPNTGETKVELLLWLTNEAGVEEDAFVCINTLGLIGEKYVEIIPGTMGTPLLKNGDVVAGVDSISMQKVTRKGYDVLTKIEKAAESFNDILDRIKAKEGTIGKLFMEDKLYKDIEKMMEDLKILADDLKRHPWKLLHRPGTKKKQRKDKETEPGGGGSLR